MLSRLVITFLPGSKCLLISWLKSPSAVVLEPQKIKSDTVAKVLEPTTGFSTWESDKGTENPPGNLSLKAVGFDYRTSTALRKQTLGGHKKNLM